jgi:hypothetical protein
MTAKSNENTMKAFQFLKFFQIENPCPPHAKAIARQAGLIINR